MWGDFFCSQSDADSESRKPFFESEQIWNFFVPCHTLIYFLNVNYLGHLEESKIFKHTVLVTKWPSFRKTALDFARSIKKIFSLLFEIGRKNDICYLYLENFFFKKKFFFLELSNS